MNIQNIRYVEFFDLCCDERYKYDEQKDIFNFKESYSKREYFETHPSLMEKDNKIYYKPYLKITYSDSDFEILYFNTLEEAEIYAKETFNYFKEIKI